MIALPPVSLDDKYAATRGRVLLSGIQALVRLTIEQRRLDDARGLNTRVFVSGYQGSPLGGLDIEMARARPLLDPAGVVFQPGVNEELAATAVAGTQLLRQVPGRRHDGVTGFWYGKNPGLDRAADAIRHGTLAGTAARGGAVAWIGDDPAGKSSTVPSSCELMAASLSLPLLAPTCVGDVVELGLHAVAMSRYAGLWTGLKIVADIADASAVVDVGPLAVGIPSPPDDRVASPPTLVGPASLAAEQDLLTSRLDRAIEYARTCGLNRITFDARGARLGVVAAGLGYAAVERALEDLGIGEAELERLGVRLIKLGMPFPLDPAEIARLVDGLAEVLVVEDKTAFIEDRLKAALFRRAHAPAVVGRNDPDGRTLLPVRGALGAEDVARALTARIVATVGEELLPASARRHLQLLDADLRDRRSLPLSPAHQQPARTPFFCSGCPHNTSTRADDETLVGVGIGCHIMVALDQAGRGRQIGMTQMGGEGAQWFGLAPFTDDKHFVQNLGDGTFHHSGSLAVRAAVAAGVNMTFKLLYNDAVAMTGGQQAVGRLSVPAVTRLLATEGVSRIIITTPDPDAYRGARLDAIAVVRHRDDFVASERELAATEGVTVLIHDDRCAADERRLRKRGKLSTPAQRVLINERVCEGCGDCGEKSSCLSVQPVETTFGRKTRIHQPSCNFDFSCVKGDCPSFLLVEPAHRRRPLPDLPFALTEPTLYPADHVLLRMPGIGGTGVVTVSQILQMAAHLSGLFAAGLEQTGLAQKGGPVVSDVRISKGPISGSIRASRATADVLLGFDLLGAAEPGNLRVLRPEGSTAIVNTSFVPTAAMVTGRVALPGSTDDAADRICEVLHNSQVLLLDAQRLSESLFGDHMPANMLLLGAAYQSGSLPVHAEAIEQAIRLNGAAVEKTLAAFRWGRAVVLDREDVLAAVAPQQHPDVAVDDASAVLAARIPGLRDTLAPRVADLAGFQNASLARRYVDDVAELFRAASARVGADVALPISKAYAVGLHRLMAYKDEYEVARLHLDPVERSRRAEEFGPKARTQVLLHPPALRALGLKRKIRLGRAADPTFRVLRAARVLRGTRLDVFGYAHVRRVERALVDEYRASARQAVELLTESTAAQILEILDSVEGVRGYEDIKLANVEAYRRRSASLLQALRARASASPGGERG